MQNLSLQLLAACLGIIFFFSILLAPMVFKVLNKESASLYLRNFFPRFYISLALLCAIAGGVNPEPFESGLIFLCSALFLLSRWPLTPAINKATDNQNKKLFTTLHGLSVLILVTQLVIMFTILLNSYVNII